MLPPMRFSPVEFSSTHYTHTGGSEFDNIVLSGPVAEKIGLAAQYNRLPELHRMDTFLKDTSSDMNISFKTPEQTMAFLDESAKDREMSPGFREYFTQMHSGPIPPAEVIPLHGKSKQLFMEGESGHAFTGLVRISVKDSVAPSENSSLLPSENNLKVEASQQRGPEGKTYKIFLAPVQPSIGGSMDESKIYAVKEPDTEKTYSIYSTQPIQFKALHHNKNNPDGWRGPTAHSQLMNIIERKENNKSESQKGKYVAFTVVKGKIADGAVNQYTFTSGTIHLGGFPELKTREAPEEWQNVIQDTFDQLSREEWQKNNSVTWP